MTCRYTYTQQWTWNPEQWEHIVQLAKEERFYRPGSKPGGPDRRVADRAARALRLKARQAVQAKRIRASARIAATPFDEIKEYPCPS